MCALIGVPIALMVARGSQLDDQLIGDSNFTRIASQAGGFGDSPASLASVLPSPRNPSLQATP